MYFQVNISAEDKKQADNILNTLLKKKLVTGGQFIKAPARFWWEGEIVDIDYFTITTFTIDKHKEEIISIVKKLSEEEVPTITFTKFESNKELLSWIDKTVG